MQPSLNSSKRDPKNRLLLKVFKSIESKTAKKVYARNGIKNSKMMIVCIKILFISMYYSYDISKVIEELKRDKKLNKLFGIGIEIDNPGKVYEYMARYNPKQYINIVNSLLKTVNKPRKRGINTFLVDATGIACDINTVRKYIGPEKLKELKLKWGYSTTKGSFIGFKATMTLDKDTLTPLSILIHPGAPNDTKVFDEVISELKRRRIIKNKDRIILDRGYCSKANYELAINKYHVVPLIFPKSTIKIEDLENSLSYPLTIYSKTKNLEEEKKLIKYLAKVLIKTLKEWNELKPVRGLIEDFFKVGKMAFGLGKFHVYTEKSIIKHVYLCFLLTTLVIEQGYKSKKKMQQLAEGNIELKPVKKQKNKKNQNKTKKDKKEKVPQKTEQKQLDITIKQDQTTLLQFAKI